MSDTTESAKPGGFGVPGGSLVFDYTDAEIATIRDGTMLDRHAEGILRRRNALARGFMKWAVIGFVVVCVIMVLVAIFDESFDNSGWWVLPGTLIFILFMAAMFAPIFWFRFSRPAKSRKLNLISKGQAQIRAANDKTAIIRFGGPVNARQWNFPPEEVAMIINGEFYDVYWAGDLLVYVELAHLEPEPS